MDVKRNEDEIKISNLVVDAAYAVIKHEMLCSTHGATSEIAVSASEKVHKCYGEARKAGIDMSAFSERVTSLVKIMA